MAGTGFHSANTLNFGVTSSVIFLKGWRPRLAFIALFSLLFLIASLIQDFLLIFGLMESSSKIWILDVDSESSLFTWVSVLTLFFVALLLFQLGQGAIARNNRFKWHWYFLAAVFLALSFDEFSAIHEKLSAALAARFDNTGLLYFAWAAPAGMISLAGLVAFVPFIRSFPPRLAVLLIVSALVFLGGAIGLEMLGGAVAEIEGIESLRYRLLANAEEGAELAGVLIFIYVLLACREIAADRI